MTEDNKYFIGVRFGKSSKAYFFGFDEEIAINTPIVVETVRGIELAQTCTASIPINEYKSLLELKSIIRIATTKDLALAEANAKKAEYSLSICEKEIQKLNLDMRLVDSSYILDGSKVTISYVADERVDFRELLKILAPQLKCRVELRQIGARDKAKEIGGIGICGLPLCCSTFLESFDGISINRAKNQMLALNIPKLSGQCGKLICCLLYEDKAYEDAKKDFPNVGKKFIKDNIEYRITSINVLSRLIKIESSEGIQFVPLEDIQKYL